MQEYKIIFAGSMGAGKTTSIQSLSDDGVVSTDVVNTNRTSNAKLLTTVGIDYGQIFLSSDVKISLYGTPGQERFQLIWKIVARGALGAIILIDSSSKAAPSELPYYVNHFNKSGIDNIVIGLTHVDLSSGFLSLDDAIKLLSEHDLIFPVFSIDPRQREDVLLLIEALLSSIEADIC